MPGGPEILVRTLTWNVGHGLDAPPDRDLGTWRSRLFRVTEMNATHAQVNRPLAHEFAAVLGRCAWDVAFLQEAPPRWLDRLARGSGARGAASALTARNFGAPFRARLADLNPDLMDVHEGGSNQVLVRSPWEIAETRRLTLTRRPERRRMLWARIRGPGDATLCVATVHLTAHDSPKAGREALLAARKAVAWAGGSPLILGGDFNDPDTFPELREHYGFGPEPEAESATISHLLARGAAVVAAPSQLPDAEREVDGPRGRRLRLSDHPLVVADFTLARPSSEDAAEQQLATG
jgi:endonuclease/exonuclease/phosphatase family metal-dependent hydrolase